MITAQKQNTTQQELIKLKELSITLAGQEQSALAAVAQSDAQLEQIRAELAEARGRLVELERQAEIERKEAELSDQVRKMRTVADRVNKLGAQLADALQELQCMDPRGEVLLFENIERPLHHRLPVAVSVPGNPKILITSAVNLPATLTRPGFDRKVVMDLLKALDPETAKRLQSMGQ